MYVFKINYHNCYMKKPYLSFTGSEVQLNSDHILLLKEYNESQLCIYIHVFMGTILIWKINFKFFLLRCLTHCTRYYFENHQNNNWSKFQSPKIGFCAPFWFKMAHGGFASHHKTIWNKWQNLTRYLCMAVYSTRRDGQKFCGSNYTETATFLYVYSPI